MCLQVFIYAFRHFRWLGGRCQWPCLFRGSHQVQGHFPWPWNFIYNPWNLLYLSGRSWFQFSIRVSIQDGVTEFSLGSLSGYYCWSLRHYCQYLHRCRRSLWHYCQSVAIAAYYLVITAVAIEFRRRCRTMRDSLNIVKLVKHHETLVKHCETHEPRVKHHETVKHHLMRQYWHSMWRHWCSMQQHWCSMQLPVLGAVAEFLAIAE